MTRVATAASLISLALLGLVACSGGGSNTGFSALAGASGRGVAGSSNPSGGASSANGGASSALGGAPSANGGSASGGSDSGAGGSSYAVTMSNGFVHPGVLVSKGMLDFVKSKIAAGAQPWKSALAEAAGDALARVPYTAHPLETVGCGPFSNPDFGCSDEVKDADAAYTQALLWYYTGNEKYATSAIAIMNAWSRTVQAHAGPNAPLQAAWAAQVFPRAAEIIRYSNAGWVDDDIDGFATMLTTVYLPEVVNGVDANGNWELSMADATIGIGIFTNDQDVFAKGVALWRKRTPAYIYLGTDGPTPVPPPNGNYAGDDLLAYWYNQAKLVDGLSQETCRDLGHVQYGLAAMIDAAESASIQGVDLIAEERTRISATLEFHAQFVNGAPIPNWLCGGFLFAATAEPTWEIGYNQYATTLGLALPNTRALIARQRPSRADHHMVWETLTHGDVGSVGLPATEK